MKNPNYHVPTTLEEAVAILSSEATRSCVIAGGTDLVPRMRAGEICLDVLIDLRLLGLDSIRVEDDQVCIGSCVTHTQIINSELLTKSFPALVAACRTIGGLSVRNRGTLGGNLANASPSADSATPLLVYDASLVLTGKDSERMLPLREFFKGLGATAMRPDEILKEVHIPIMPKRTAASFIKLGKRQAMAIAVVSTTVRITLGKGGEVVQARIALGSVAPAPLRAERAERILINQELNDDLISASACEAARIARPISDVRASAHYRMKMVEVLVRRALTNTMKDLMDANNNG